MFERFRHRQTFFVKLWYTYGKRLHRWMIAKDANFYLKPNDIISHRPTRFGTHEPHIEALITEASATHCDFLLDIGANIGMTSALVGRRFRRVDCVEPNELVVNILKTNLAMNLSATEHEVHAVDLGKEDGLLTLRVPPDNFGGAYVEDDNPQFDCEMSARHSNQFSDRSDHLALDVVIREAGKWLEGRFTAMREAGLSKGVLRLNSRDMKRLSSARSSKRFPPISAPWWSWKTGSTGFRCRASRQRSILSPGIMCKSTGVSSIIFPSSCWGSAAHMIRRWRR